ncbi:MAG TPA: glycoside hydrolase family 44 protein [Ktedonobacterales bacterium]|nr:glycoside hydrolase family 44 protein [Ktedonobacterales bacterium]
MNAVQRVTRTPVKRRKRSKAGFRLVLLLLAGALVIGGALGVANLLRSATTLIVRISGQAQVRVDLNQSLALSPYLLGSNVFPVLGTSSKDPGGQGFMSYDPQVVAGLRSAGVKLLRFPGGNFDEEHALSPQQLDAFNDLLNQVGAEGFMQVQLSDPLDKKPVPLATRATRASLLVEYMNNPQSIQRSPGAPYHPIKYWSVGNEPDLLINPDTGKRYTVAEYTQAFIAYSLAMHTRDPSIQVFGPELSRYSAAGGPEDSQGIFWMQGFLQGVGDYERTHNLPFHLLDGVSFHYYPFGDGQQDATTMLNDPPQWDTLMPGLHQLIRQTIGADLPIAITEVNTNAIKAPPPQNLSALWWAETLGALMNNQADYVAFFSTEGVDSPNPLFLQKDLTQTAMLRVMQLFSRLQSQLVPVQDAQGSVSIYATQDGGHATASLLFVNQTSSSQQISVQAENILPWSSWQGLQAWSSWQTASLTLQGYSMAVLTLHRDGSDEAFSFDNTASSQQGAPEVQHAVCSSATGVC